MGIEIGAGDYPISYKTMRTQRETGRTDKNDTKSTHVFNKSSSITLHLTNEQTNGKALTCVGFPNGVSASVYKAEGYTEENPQYRVKYWDKSGEEAEYIINPKEVNPANADYIEMLAYSTYSDVQGYTSNAYGKFLSAAGGINGELTYDLSNIDEKTDFISIVKEFMQMQYDANNLNGYLSYKQLYDYMRGSLYK
ncbi:MAG: hypothetical protein J5981_06090 [Lachnospira sp.]|nr:hypothetical protein [Lachnospira sp.]